MSKLKSFLFWHKTVHIPNESYGSILAQGRFQQWIAPSKPPL